MTKPNQTVSHCQFSGKVSYPNRSEAWHWAQHVSARNSSRKASGSHKGQRASVYRCEHCSGFHLTSGRVPT